jgi:transcriptional adapter 2-alpha
LDGNAISEWLCADEMNLIETIETCGLGNWVDIASKVSRDSVQCQTHFEQIYLSPLSSSLSIAFQSFPPSKHLIGEKEINGRNEDLASSSIIYPLMLISNEQQKSLTYMANRDEYEREYFNEAEHRLPTQLTSDEQQINGNDDEQDGSRKLINQGKLTLLRSYGQILRRRLQLKDFVRDYALAFSFPSDQK